MESPQKTVLVDPLSGFSLVSLFPRTFNQRDLDPDPNRWYNDPLETAGAHLESLALKNPNKLLEQAKSILDGGLESLNVDNLDNVRVGDTVGHLLGVNIANLQRDTENLKNASYEDTVGDLRGGNHKNLQGRRPGLGRKRSHFSLKQNSSQSMESLMPFVDMDKLPDPEEFFLAFEKHENAKNELRKQSGALMDLDQNVPHIAERRRRPGLLRKSASYKHRFSMAPSGDEQTFLSSQETQSQDLCSPTPSNHCLQPEHTGQENAGEERPDDICDESQSSQDNDDESDEIIGMLQKRFKPIELNKSCLPVLSSVLQSEFRSIGESLQESHDKMSDLHDIVSTIGKETTLGYNNLERRSGHPSTSPKRPKSPYSSISLLKARLFQSRRGKDPFSALDSDLSPVGKAGSCKGMLDLAATDVQKSVKDNVEMQNISSVNGMDIESGYATGDSDIRETNLNSPVHESECNVVNRDTQEFGAAEFTSYEKNKGDSMMSDIPTDSIEHMDLDDDNKGDGDVYPSLHLHDKETDATHTMETAKDISKTFLSSDDVMHIELDHAIRRNQTPQSAEHETESNVVHTKDMPEFDHNIMTYNTIGGVLEDNPNEVSDAAAISADERIEPDNGEVEEDVEGGNMENSNCNKEQSTANAVEDLGKDRRSSDRDILSSAGANDDLDHDRPSSSRAQPLKKTRKASSKMAERNRSKAREPAHDPPPAERIAPAARKQTRELKELSQRKSLAACGTQWEAGLRRSTRIRTRPLEYWKGERPLYGRIHDSLITVVGTKFFSPGKDTFNVKSYVSDEYKEIVERAALH